MDLVRELARAANSIENYSCQHIRKLGLTAPQYEVLLLLGSTGPLTFRGIGDKTRIVKTTLTGIIDRLEEKALVRRASCAEDRRCVFVELTGEGQAFYDKIYPEYVARLEKCFADLPEDEIEECRRFLRRVRSSF